MDSGVRERKSQNMSGSLQLVAGRVSGVNEIGKREGVPNEEYRGIVADQVVIALLGLKLEREARGGPGRRRLSLFPPPWKNGQRPSPLTNFREKFGFGVFGHIRGNFEVTTHARTLGFEELPVIFSRRVERHLY